MLAHQCVATVTFYLLQVFPGSPCTPADECWSFQDPLAEKEDRIWQCQCCILSYVAGSERLENLYSATLQGLLHWCDFWALHQKEQKYVREDENCWWSTWRWNLETTLSTAISSSHLALLLCTLNWNSQSTAHIQLCLMMMNNTLTIWRW